MTSHGFSSTRAAVTHMFKIGKGTFDVNKQRKMLMSKTEQIKRRQLKKKQSGLGGGGGTVSGSARLEHCSLRISVRKASEAERFSVESVCVCVCFVCVCVCVCVFCACVCRCNWTVPPCLVRSCPIVPGRGTSKIKAFRRNLWAELDIKEGGGEMWQEEVVQSRPNVSAFVQKLRPGL